MLNYANVSSAFDWIFNPAVGGSYTVKSRTLFMAVRDAQQTVRADAERFGGEHRLFIVPMHTDGTSADFGIVVSSTGSITEDRVA